MEDIPNFAAWRTETLAKFAADAYRKMQEQAVTIEVLQNALYNAVKVIAPSKEEQS